MSLFNGVKLTTNTVVFHLHYVKCTNVFVVVVAVMPELKLKNNNIISFLPIIMVRVCCIDTVFVCFGGYFSIQVTVCGSRKMSCLVVDYTYHVVLLNCEITKNKHFQYSMFFISKKLLLSLVFFRNATVNMSPHLEA